MNEVLEFLTSLEAIVVYIVVGISCCLCFIIYLVDKYNTRLRRRHNTKELNKLVSQIKVEANVEDEEQLYEQPVLETIDENVPASSVVELLEQTTELYEKPAEEEIIETPEIIEVEPIEKIEKSSVEIEQPEELKYTTIEPNREEAQEELSKLTEELQQQEEEIENNLLTNYELEQEENAIISLEELIEKSKAMYEANELTQYDEGNEPISLEELEEKAGKEAVIYEEPFIIENVVPKEEIKENTVVEVVPEKVEEASKKFKSSPIISPVFGIEKSSNTDLELENTANYTKFDAEIQKTNEFLMTLKELQEKLE